MTNKIDISAPGVAKVVAKRVLDDIDAFCKESYDGGHRAHLGASLIGDTCKRKLWYTFRWCVREDFNGRMLRLFNRGHREEERFTEWLKGIGAEVWTHTDDGNQYRVSDVMGHFGGSLDGIVKLPERYGIDAPMLLEFKTNGTGRAFDKLTEDGMAVAKPQHFAQTSVYGSDPKYNFTHVLYLNINKNDDSIHCEIVKLDHKLGNNLREKAKQIILSQEAPPRLSNNPTYKDCSYCAAKNICHKGALPEKNCRSCRHAKPVENAEWFCEFHNAVIPKDFIPKACDNYIPITSVSEQ